MKSNLNNTIIACCSGLSENVGVSKIRISGNIPDNFFLIFNIQKETIKPRYCYFKQLFIDNEFIDEIVLIYFEKGKSFTGEEVVELDVHGNRLNVQEIINKLCLHFNFTRASPGEFTFRAFLNKKLNLNDVETLNLFLNAKNRLSLNHARSAQGGDLARLFSDLYDAVERHKIALECNIDFLDDIGESQSIKDLNSSLESLKEVAQKLYQKTSLTKNILKPTIVIFGEPNAGKSSFFNALLASERSIVSSIKGTTRDYVSEEIQINSNTFTLIDTAGIRDSIDEIENIGVKRSLSVLNKSFLKVLVINPYDEFKIDLVKIRPDLICFTHKDLDNFNLKLTLTLKLLEGHFGPIEPVEKINGFIEPKDEGFSKEDRSLIKIKYLELDLKNGINNDDLEIFTSYVDTMFMKLYDGEPILLERHIEKIRTLFGQLNNYCILLNQHMDIGIVANEFELVEMITQELIGVIHSNELLDKIFSGFCIGK